ncbi:MAG: sensor histidine kinase [Solirubrobacteraceae bacterium]
MSTLSSDHGRVHAASALTDLGWFRRAAVKLAHGFAGRAAAHAAGVTRRRTGRLIGRIGFRERRIPAAALAEDRRRIAADVHDLIMQDLSIALATARSLADHPASAAQASLVVAAGERALAGARDVLQGLVERDDPKSVAEAVEASVRQAARRAPVTFEAIGVAHSEDADQPTVLTLVHVAREAVTNAIKHSGPSTPVEVVFERGEEWRLTVRDRGRGFDPDVVSTGFGLESMRTQARGMGGLLRIHSAPGEGSTVELTLP